MTNNSDQSKDKATDGIPADGFNDTLETTSGPNAAAAARSRHAASTTTTHRRKEHHRSSNTGRRKALPVKRPQKSTATKQQHHVQSAGREMNYDDDGAPYNPTAAEKKKTSLDNFNLQQAPSTEGASILLVVDWCWPHQYLFYCNQERAGRVAATFDCN